MKTSVLNASLLQYWRETGCMGTSVHFRGVWVRTWADSFSRQETATLALWGLALWKSCISKVPVVGCLITSRLYINYHFMKNGSRTIRGSKHKFSSVQGLWLLGRKSWNTWDGTKDICNSRNLSFIHQHLSWLVLGPIKGQMVTTFHVLQHLCKGSHRVKIFCAIPSTQLVSSGPSPSGKYHLQVQVMYNCFHHSSG